MRHKVHFIPEGYPLMTPYLIIRGAAQALEFYHRAFGAQEAVRMPMTDGTIAHAEMTIAQARFMVADESVSIHAKSPEAYKGTPVVIHLYVPDVDAFVKQAVAAGARLITPVQDQFYGDRSGMVLDPFGHLWSISTHIEDVSPEEMEKRMASWGKK